MWKWWGDKNIHVKLSNLIKQNCYSSKIKKERKKENRGLNLTISTQEQNVYETFSFFLKIFYIVDTVSANEKTHLFKVTIFKRQRKKKRNTTLGEKFGMAVHMTFGEPLPMLKYPGKCPSFLLMGAAGGSW